MYLASGIPWFRLYDDYIKSINHTSPVLENIASVSQIDKHKKRFSLKMKTKARAEEPQPPPSQSDQLIDPKFPPPCSQHPSTTSTCVFRPCGHTVCSHCLGEAMLAGSKCSCGSPVAKFIGIDRPLPQLSNEDPDERNEYGANFNHWNVKEIEQLSTAAYAHGTVRLIHLREDNVAPLRRRN